MQEEKKIQNITRPPGVQVIKEILKIIPQKSGVYRMIGVKGEILYVGKALNLKKRVMSYTHTARLPERLQLMVSLTADMEIVVTKTEAEALLLEANYIRRMKPRFNILLRDDKSYPWLLLTGNHIFPRLMRQRGKPQKKAIYWGPFASAKTVENTIQVLQKLFLLRTCTDSDFSSRTRPCLQYQIKRCSAPCVDRISKDEYKSLIEQAREFLSGGGRELQQTLTHEMETASEELDFERAALIRDRIRGFANLRSSSVINPRSIEEADVIALWKEAGETGLQVFFIRGGRNNGNRAFFPKHDPSETEESVLAAFVLQFYDDKQPPSNIVTHVLFKEQELLEEALSLKKGRKVTIIQPKRGEKKAVLDHALLNAKEVIERKLAENAGQKKILERVATLFDLPRSPARIEVYDNSHIMGQSPYGVMIVAGAEGFIKRAYRKYAIKDSITPGDDFGMMREVMRRRFAHLTHNSEEYDENWPDLLLIDGGKGQVRAVREILEELDITDIPIVGIAKGVDRNSGREWFLVQGKEPFQLPVQDPVLYYLQRLRDESHRFAITTHRAGRSKAFTHSKLNDIPGIGSVRKKSLLARFGSLRNVKAASLEDLGCVPGINQEIAHTIYGYFHPEWVRKQNEIKELTD